MPLNDMTGSEGRFGNHIIRAHAASFIAKVQNLKFNYGEYFNKMKELGINLFTEGTMTYNSELKIPSKNIMFYLESPLFKNINVNQFYYQTSEFSNYLYKYYQTPEIQESIINSNKFKTRYKNNNDVFVHVRLGDVAQHNPGLSYYDKLLSKLSFENGYIASDDFNHEICQKIITKYNLKIIDYNEVDTIMFGSTCKNIILTGGSFSYIIGLFGFFSKIYYSKGFDKWWPDELFFIKDWTEVL